MTDTLPEVYEREQSRYLSCAETAKLLRPQLKAAFPGVKFSVRSSTYAGGASIDVRWTDGPKESDVRGLLQSFSGKDFDGMIDMASYVSHWLNPDGTVSLAHRQGTTGSRGVIPEQIGSRQHPDAIEVHLGADYVHGTRDISPEWAAELKAEIEQLSGKAFDWNETYDLWVRDDGTMVECTGQDAYRCWGSSIFNQLHHHREGVTR